MNSDTGLEKPKPKTDLMALRQKIATLPAKARLDAILSCPDVIRVVRGMPLQDLYVTVREVGPGDSLELIELLHPRQVQGFLDLDGWRHDRLDSVGMGDWLELIFAADPMRAVKQMRGIDVELLSLLLKIHTRVYELEVEEPPDDDLGLHTVTPDQRFLIVFDAATGPVNLMQGLKNTVDMLFGRDMPFILRILQAVRWELPSALEEEAYRWRNARLGDLGFPDPTEAKSIFAWLDPDAQSSVAVTVPPSFDEFDEEAPSTNLSASVLLPWSVLSDGSTLLGGALAEMVPAVSERITHELMLVANHVHLANGGDLGDPGAVRDTVVRVTDTLGIALAYRAKGERSSVVTALRDTPLRDLFRRGHSLSLKLQRELRQLLADPRSGLSVGLLALDSPLREVMAGLLRRQPLFFTGLTKPGHLDYRHFASLAEIAETAHALSEAAFRSALLGPRGLGLDEKVLADFAGGETSAIPPQGVLLATAMSQVLLGGGGLAPASKPDRRANYGPLDDDGVQALFALGAQSGGGFQFDDAARDLAVGSVEGLARDAGHLPGATTTEAAIARAGAFAKQALRLIEMEFEALKAPIDPRFVASVWTVAAVTAYEVKAVASEDDDSDSGSGSGSMSEYSARFRDEEDA